MPNDEQQMIRKILLSQRAIALKEKLNNIVPEVFKEYRNYKESIITKFIEVIEDYKCNVNIAILTEETIPSELLELLANYQVEPVVLCHESSQHNCFKVKILPENYPLPEGIPEDTEIVFCTNIGLATECFELQKRVIYWANSEDEYLSTPVFLQALNALPIIVCLDQNNTFPYFVSQQGIRVKSDTDLFRLINELSQTPTSDCRRNNKDQTLSVCMIVKDEEEHLPRCLEHISKFADEIIVVDTGSTDNTITIAQEFGAKIYYYTWRGDFAAARNESLRHATGEWILVLDADEVISESECNNLRQFINRALGNMYKVNIYNQAVDFTDTLVNQMIRLFKNSLGFYYEGTLHEQLRLPSGTECNISDSPICIKHYGYLPNNIEKKDKHQRNKTILENFLKDHPNNPFYLFNYGTQYMNERNWERAIFYFRKSFLNSKDPAHYHQLLLDRLTTCLIHAKRNLEAIQVLQDAKRVYPLYPDFPFLEGNVYFAQKRYDEAKKAFLKALKIGDIHMKTTSHFGRGSFLSAYFLADIAYHKKNYSEALELLETWMPRLDHLPQPKGLWAVVAAKTLTYNEVWEHLKTGFWHKRESLFELLLFLVITYLEQYNQSSALSLLESFPEDYQKWDVWLFLRGLISFRENNYNEAWNFWTSISNLNHHKTSTILAFAYWVEGKREEANHLSSNVGRLFAGEKIDREAAEMILRELIWYRGDDLDQVAWDYPDQELLAEIFLSYGQKELALKALINAVQRASISAEGYKNLGDLSRELGLNEDAEIFWDQALTANGENWEIYQRLLDLYTEQNNKDKANALLNIRRQVFYPEQPEVVEA